ncbi:SMC-Scp complex subunit ScpB [Amycolatopsis antarctica]|uniref:SMC-Scp complex subunit ScpB n=1 Tax=Amycolatopsis antarctica TaxID=1854586 RepID=A0A263CXZ3_9PSEU|nr:SMC-Scp complex subunit ScpB [Amycolatopsis antarctica]
MPREPVAVEPEVTEDAVATMDVDAEAEPPAGPGFEDGGTGAPEPALPGPPPPEEDIGASLPGEDPVAMEHSGTAPDLSGHAELEAALEALLLVVDSPANEESLAGALDQPVDRVTEALRTMASDLTDRNSGIDLRRIGEGWRFYTRDTFAPYVEKLLLDGQRAKLTRAALETLAVIAYRQPVTRARVAAVRGVNVDGVIRTLLARGLIEETGTDSETGGTLYVTTELFLERLGLSSLSDLPPIAPLLPEVDSIDDI